VRYVLGVMVSSYLWQGGLLVLLAAVAGFTGWRNDEDLPDEEEASVVTAEP